MPWLDPARLAESEEDRALRGELRRMLALPAQSIPPAPTAESVALANDLAREALRRMHTPAVVRRFRPNWTLLAASLPLVLTALGLGAWGFQQKQKADRLAAAVAQKEVEVQRLSRSHQENLQRDRDRQVADPQLRARQLQSASTGPRPKEVVAPSQRKVGIRPTEVQQVSKPKEQ
jgi:uncharacterized protein HemX